MRVFGSSKLSSLIAVAVLSVCGSHSTNESSHSNREIAGKWVKKGSAALSRSVSRSRFPLNQRDSIRRGHHSYLEASNEPVPSAVGFPKAPVPTTPSVRPGESIIDSDRVNQIFDSSRLPSAPTVHRPELIRVEESGAINTSRLRKLIRDTDAQNREVIRARERLGSPTSTRTVTIPFTELWNLGR